MHIKHETVDGWLEKAKASREGGEVVLMEDDVLRRMFGFYVGEDYHYINLSAVRRNPTLDPSAEEALRSVAGRKKLIEG